MEKNMESRAYARLAALFDDGAFTEINAAVKEAEDAAGVVCAYGYVNGNAVYAFSQDKTVNNGAVGLQHATKITKLYGLAAKTGTPIVGIHDSNGAFVNGTVDSLTAYGRMLEAASQLSGVVPQIAVVAGTCAGSAALLACGSDFVVMTKDAELFVAPPFAEHAGTAQSAAKAGICALVCEDDTAAMEQARALVNLMPINNLAGAPMFEYAESESQASPSLPELVKAVADADSLLELYGDYGKAAYTALATLGGTTVGIAATNKTEDPLNTEDCAKLARFMRTCDAFSVPVITFVDTMGFAASSEAEQTGSIQAMTRLAACYAEATTIKLSVVTGNAMGAAFTALAGAACGADFTYAWDQAVISPMAPLTAVEFLWHDKLKGAADANAKRKELAAEYAATLASAQSAAEKGGVDAVIAPADTRVTLLSALDILSGKRVSKLPKKHNNIPF